MPAARGNHGYIARDLEGVVRYVGIGNRNRYKHVNSGYSHCEELNAYVAAGFCFDLELFVFKSSEEAHLWEPKTIDLHGRINDGSGTLFNKSYSQGGVSHQSNRGRKRIWNAQTGHSCFIPIEALIPEGYVRGFPPQGANTGGKKAYNDGTRVIFLKPGVEIPKGFTKGNPKKPEWIAAQTGRSCPSTKGRRFVTNNLVEFLLGRDEKPPEGFHFGRLPTKGEASHKGMIFITNGSETHRVPPEAPLPEGFSPGRHWKPR